MPVKIQELIIQTRIKADVRNLVEAKGVNYATQQELRHFEEQLRTACVETMDTLLKERKER
jgi:hypothetical protein